MKCRKQPAFLEGKPTPITDLWEVHLPSRLWELITIFAAQYKTTFSTITRFCVFRLCSRHHALRWRKKLRELHQIDREECRAEEKPHRHIVCFYGEDLKWVKLVAAELEITVSAFIRLALRLFLRYFAMKNHSKRPTANQLFWQAIKIHWLLRLFRLPYNTRQRRFIRYPPHDFPAGHRWGFSGGNALPLAACF